MELPMSQEEHWQRHYKQIMEFMEQTHRRPSRHRVEEHRMLNWLKYNKKLIAKGQLSAERVKLFNELMDIAEQYRRLNQYV